MRLLNTLGVVLFFVFNSCAQEEDSLLRSESRSVQEYAPQTSLGYKIQHRYYTLSYSSKHRQAEYAYYYLSPESIRGGQARTDDFRIDPKVKSNPVKSTDYQGSGYDRGHLCPAADMALNLTAMSETFFMSNMSPMAPSFNRGIWSRLEDWVREEALGNSGLYVVTGPILSKSCGSIKGSITVPCAYYKIVFTGGSQPRMLGFVLSNAGASGSLKGFAVSVDEIEKRTGLDFFPQLDNTLEQSLESKVSFSGWRF
jgi:endonuclease G